MKSYLKEKYQKPGNVFLGVVHRLDKPVSGALVFARTSKAAARLSEQFREGAVEKVYWAVVEDPPASGRREPAVPGTCKNGFARGLAQEDDAKARVEVVPKETPGARLRGSCSWSRTSQRPNVARTPPAHRPQAPARVQLASRGSPIHGDAKYGSDRPFAQARVHARSLTFLHPTTKEPITVTAEVPKIWRGRFAHLLPTLK